MAILYPDTFPNSLIILAISCVSKHVLYDLQTGKKSQIFYYFYRFFSLSYALAKTSKTKLNDKGTKHQRLIYLMEVSSVFHSLS